MLGISIRNTIKYVFGITYAVCSDCSPQRGSNKKTQIILIFGLLTLIHKIYMFQGRCVLWFGCETSLNTVPSWWHCFERLWNSEEVEPRYRKCVTGDRPWAFLVCLLLSDHGHNAVGPYTLLLLCLSSWQSAFLLKPEAREILLFPGILSHAIWTWGHKTLWIILL